MSNTLIEEALSRLPEGTDRKSIVRVTRTTDDAHPGADLRVQLATGSFVWLMNPDYEEGADEVVGDGTVPQLGAAAFDTLVRQAIADGRITEFELPNELTVEDAHRIAAKLGVELPTIPKENPPEIDPGTQPVPESEEGVTINAVTGSKIDPDADDPDNDGLDSTNVTDLRATAKAEGLTGYSKLAKADLVAAIREHRAEA